MKRIRISEKWGNDVAEGKLPVDHAEEENE
jgi:hypothetical protein